jgi:hypothetical protein
MADLSQGEGSRLSGHYIFEDLVATGEFKQDMVQFMARHANKTNT